MVLLLLSYSIGKKIKYSI